MQRHLGEARLTRPQSTGVPRQRWQRLLLRCSRLRREVLTHSRWDSGACREGRLGLTVEEHVKLPV